MTSMQAWQIESLGTDARLNTLAIPTPKTGEVLIKVHASGLNFADLLMAQGKYQSRPTPPVTTGLELAGTVEALGPDTPQIKLFSRVAAHVKSGAFAEYAIVCADQLVALPETMPFETAAGFLIAYGTAHLALARKAQLRAGETVFVTGAAGGVGLTAVEVAHQLGARVIASARGPDKAEIARAAGADLVIDSDSRDLKEQLRDAGGIDVTFDTVGGAGFDAAMRATRPGGRMLAIGFAGGEVPQVPLNQLLVRNISVIGLWWGGYLDFAPRELTDSLAELFSWWQAGRLHPLISEQIAFADLPRGLDLIRRREAKGKLILKMP